MQRANNATRRRQALDVSRFHPITFHAQRTRTIPRVLVSGDVALGGVAQDKFLQRGVELTLAETTARAKRWDMASYLCIFGADDCR